MKQSVLAVLLVALAASPLLALEMGETEFEHNGWFRYTNQSTKFAITDPSVSRFALERGYVRLSHQWTNQLFTKFTVDMFSSDKYAEGATVRLKEGYLDLALPLKDFTLTAGLQKHYFGLIYSWDYTNPDKALADDRGIAASADYGITVNGFLPSGLGELQLGVYNGEGYKYAGKYVNLSPELLANLRLTPLAGLQFGASVFSNAQEHVHYKNDKKGRNSGGTAFENADTVNANRLGIAPMARVAFGPVSLTGEYIIYNYTREFSYYAINRDSSGAVVDSPLNEKSKDYAMTGLDLNPLVSLLGRKLEVHGRFATWQAKEQSGDSMPVNLAKSFTRVGAGVNWHFQRREKGKPGAALQLGWYRDQTRVEGADPKDTFMAQFRFEWNAVLRPPTL